jgi:hypothetical protein
MAAHYSVKSRQRKVRQVHIIANAAGTALTGLDSNQASMADTGTGVKTITLDKAFASADYIVQVTTATADSHAEVSITSAGVFVVNTFDTGDGTTAKDAICHISVYGSDVSDRY